MYSGPEVMVLSCPDLHLTCINDLSSLTLSKFIDMWTCFYIRRAYVLPVVNLFAYTVRLCYVKIKVTYLLNMSQTKVRDHIPFLPLRSKLSPWQHCALGLESSHSPAAERSTSTPSGAQPRGQRSHVGTILPCNKNTHILSYECINVTSLRLKWHFSLPFAYLTLQQMQ